MERADPSDASPAPAGGKPRRALKDVKLVSHRRTGGRSPQTAFGRLEVGSVLSRTFSIYARSFLPLILMSLIVHLPLIAYTVLVSLQGTPRSFEEANGRQGTWTWVYLVSSILLPSFLAGPVTFDVVERLRGRTPSLGTSLRIGLSRIPRILLTVLMWGLFLFFVLFAAGIALAIPLGLLLAALPREAGAAIMLIVYAVGLLLFMSVFWVAIPAAVVEPLGPREALGRSARLTKRNVWKVAAVVAVLLVLGYALHFVLAQVLIRSLELSNLLQVLLVALVTGPLGAVAGALAYHDLRTTMEGVDTETLARVFE